MKERPSNVRYRNHNLLSKRMMDGDVYYLLKTQPCFTHNDGSVIRRAIRDQDNSFFSIRRLYVLIEPERPKLREECYVYDTEKICPQNTYMKSFRTYANSTIIKIARRLPFRCPFCGSDKNPFHDFDLRLDYEFHEQVYICKECAETKLARCFSDLKKVELLARQLKNGEIYYGTENNERPEEDFDRGFTLIEGCQNHQSGCESASLCSA